MKPQKRNFTCSWYSTCLHVAAEDGRATTPCRGCPFESNHAAWWDWPADLPGCLGLFLVIMGTEADCQYVRTETLLDLVFDNTFEIVSALAGDRKIGFPYHPSEGD